MTVEIGRGKSGHQQLFDAIEARDSELAARRMFEHLDLVERGLIARIGGSQEVASGPSEAATDAARQGEMAAAARRTR